MDRHDFVNATPEQFAEVHTCDLDIQDRYGVRFITYWYQAGAETSFCLVEAPSADLAQAVHAASHGNIANQVIEVDWQSVESFLGPIREPGPGEAWEDIAVRTVLCCDTSEEPGPPSAKSRRLSTERLVSREALGRGGLAMVREHGVLGGFVSVTAALECALALRDSLVPLTSLFEGAPVKLSMGLSIGEPVDGKWGLFGRPVEVASRLCDLAPPGTTFVTEDVYKRAAGSQFGFEPVGSVPLAGGERVVAYRLNGRVERDDGGALDAGREPTPEAAHGLSRREVEVLQLVAHGKTNREIARALFISEATVATHVRNIFMKAAVANRAEAASFAHRRRLI